MKKIVFAAALILGNTQAYTAQAMEKSSYDEVYRSEIDTGLTNRRMFILDQDYAAKNKILMIKGISAITDFGGRDMVVVRLIDGNEVPFYESSGANSKLPTAWLPFFGISTRNGDRIGGWINKNYSFSDRHGTGNSENPLYHSGCYVLAQICNELDSLAMDGTKQPWSTKHKGDDKIPFINAWIGGKMIEEYMPQNMGNYNFPQNPPLKAIGRHESPFVRVETVDTTKTTNKNLFGSFRDKKGTKITIKDTQVFFNDNRRLESSKLTFMHSEIKNSNRFMHDLKDFMDKMEKTYGEDVRFMEDYQAFKQLIGQTESFINIYNKEDSTQNKVNAYLGLQMVKRFSFNTFYKMLTDIYDMKKADQGRSIDKIILSSRAAWLSIKHQDFTFSGKKLENIKELLQKIKAKSSSCFDLLCYEHPVQIERFSKGESYDKNRTIIIKNDNEKLLKAIHKMVLDIYDNNFNDEMSNVHRLVQKESHKKTALDIVTHYGDEKHILNLEGVSPEKNLMIKEELEKIRKAMPKTVKDWEYSKTFYEGIFKNLSHLKAMIKTSSSIKATEKDRGLLCVKQLATWFYFDALTNIKKFD